MKKGNICKKCGYTKLHLHEGQCPLCKPCESCEKTVRKCICKEKE